MNELEELGKKKVDYMEDFINKGFTVADLVKDKTFLEFEKTENMLIAKRNSPHSNE